MEKIQEAIALARAAGVVVIAAEVDQQLGTTSPASTPRDRET